MTELLLLAGTLIVLSVGYAVLKYSRHQRALRMERACQQFQIRREWLEADFLTGARRSGKPRGLEWTNIDFDKEVSFARDRHSGQLQALVAATISFAAVPGSDMEDVEAVGNLKSATAVFRYVNNRWITDGRAVFNLSPTQTIQHFKHELEPVRPLQPAGRR